METKSKKLQAKDLINVGIFTAIYFVIFFAGMMLGYIPIFIPLLGLVCPILCGIFAGRKISKLEMHIPCQWCVFPLDHGLCEPDVPHPHRVLCFACK